MNTLKYSLQHEFTHAVCDYSEDNYANLNNLKNSISYEDNIFNIEKYQFNEIMTALYWLNKSEQDARISATMKYIREKRLAKNEINDINSDDATKYIIETYFLNQLDKFKISLKKVTTEFTNEMIYILGYYMQMHHYIYSTCYKNTIDNAIKNNEYNNELLSNIKNYYYFQFNQYQKKLYQYILRQKI